MLKEVVVTKATFDQRSLSDAHIDGARDELAPQLTFIDISSPVGQHSIQTIANTSIRTHPTAQICMHGPHAISLVAQFDFTKLLLSWALRYEIENTRGIGWAIELPAEAADHFDLLVFFKRGRCCHRYSHTVLAGVLHVATLHAAGSGTDHLRALHFLERSQRQILGGLFDISRLCVIDQLTRNHIYRKRNVQDGHRTQRSADTDSLDPIRVFRIRQDGHALTDLSQLK